MAPRLSPAVLATRSKLAQSLTEPELPQVAPHIDQPFLTASVLDIVENIKTGKEGWSAVRVLQAFIRSSRRAQERTNCLSATMYPEALAHAAWLDDTYPPGSGAVKGRLHGVPISIKDHIGIIGTEGTIGITSYLGKKFERDALIVELLKAEGAVMYVKTNVPQTMLSFESSNPIFGTTNNVWSKLHAAGGSSGGEAALLAADGSAVGIGSDVGGSLRIPAHYCGIYSLKPSKGRFPASSYASTPGAAGFASINTVLGPMARSMDDLKTLSRVVVDGMINLHQGRGPKFAGEDFVPIPWREPIEGERKYKFGYWTEDKFIRASPACQRAVIEAVEALRAKGYECIPVDPKDYTVRALEIFSGLTSADGYNTLLAPLKKDKLEPAMYLTVFAARLPWLFRLLLGWVFRGLFKDTIMHRLLWAGGKKDTEHVMKLNVKKAAFNVELREKLFKELDLDFIICPPQATPALEHGKSWDLSPLAAATILFNVPDFSAGIVPVTRVSAILDKLPSSWLSELVGKGSPVLHEALYKKGAYDAEKMNGLPVCVQVVGSNWEEEKVLDAMSILDKALPLRDMGKGQWVVREK